MYAWKCMLSLHEKRPVLFDFDQKCNECKYFIKTHERRTKAPFRSPGAVKTRACLHLFIAKYKMNNSFRFAQFSSNSFSP
jgi:hypothetical protein